MLNHRLLLSCLFLSISSCQRPPGELSQTRQIVAGPDSTCQNRADRLAGIQSRYGAYISSYSYEGEQQRAFGTFSRIPTSYLDFVFVQSRAALHLTGLCQPGLTSWTYDQIGRVPTDITSGTATPAGSCDRTDTLSHELGHAAYGAVQRDHAQFESELDNLYNWTVLQGGESGNMASYPTTNREEYFAELFDTYYCSNEARARLTQYLPKAAAFAARFLLPPPNL